MKNISIVIEKYEIIREAQLAAAYAGARGEKEADFERVAASDADIRLLGRFWHECAGRLVTVLRPVLSGIERSDSTLRLDLALSGASSEPLAEEIEAGCRSYMVAGVSARWFATVNRGEAGGAGAFAETELLSLIEKVFHRQPPRRKI